MMSIETYIPPSDRDEGQARARVIVHTLGRACMNLGVRDVVSLAYGGTDHQGHTHKGGLSARIGNGRWRLVVTVSGADLYNLAFMTSAGRVAHVVEGVYCEDLAEACIVGFDAAIWPR